MIQRTFRQTLRHLILPSFLVPFLVSVLVWVLVVPGAEARSFQIELRLPVGVGSSFGRTEQLNQGVEEKFQVKDLLTFGADALVTPAPDQDSVFKDWSAGLRFDSISSIHYDGAYFGSGNIFEVASHEFSLLVNRRWHTGDFLMGPFATVSVYHPAYVNQRFGGGPSSQFKAERSRGFALGFEGSWLYDVYLLGAELGYRSLVHEDFRDASGAKLLTPSGEEKKADLSGVYAKFLLGIRF